MKAEAAVSACAVAALLGGAAVTGVLPGFGDDPAKAPPYPDIPDDRWAITRWVSQSQGFELDRPLRFSDNFTVEVARRGVAAGDDVDVNVTNRGNRTFEMGSIGDCGLWVAEPRANWTISGDVRWQGLASTWSWDPGETCNSVLDTDRVRDGPNQRQDPSPLSPGWHRVVFAWETGSNRTALAWDDVLVRP